VLTAVQFKGTVQRDVLTPVFFIEILILVPINLPRSDPNFSNFRGVICSRKNKKNKYLLEFEAEFAKPSETE
jgi:hypothetical protein